jgi:misacylated tRNA(Ala) deacylase
VRATTRLYLDDGGLLRCQARAIAIAPDALAFDQTCFFPGGGGQPPDTGAVFFGLGDGDATLEVTSVRADDEGVLWHVTATPPPAGLAGRRAHLQVDAERRRALTRAHTALHVLNTIALRDHGAWITGVQIGVEQSRIDFTFAAFSAELVADLEAKTNAILAEDHPVTTTSLTESEFGEREDLLRTLEARPPVRDGRVRVVEIVGFDAQACGGTHVRSTAEVGRLVVIRTENKGRQNKRLYVRLEFDRV